MPIRNLLDEIRTHFLRKKSHLEVNQDLNTTGEVSVTESAVVSDNVEAYSRTAMWQWPLCQIDNSLPRLLEIESTYDDPPKTIEREHRGLAASCVISSHALMEIVANTVIFDIEQRTPATKRYEFDVEDVNKEIQDNYDSIYESVKDSLLSEPVPKKYNILLNKVGADRFNTEIDTTYKDAIIVRKFRNSLMHGKPEYVPLQSNASRETFGDYSKLNGALKGKAANSPYSNAPVFEFLSHGYAEWSATTALSIMDDFFNRIDSEPVYEWFVDEMNTSLRGE